MEKPDFEKLAIERLESVFAKWSLGDTGKLIALDVLKGAMIYVWTEHVEPLQAKQNVLDIISKKKSEEIKSLQAKVKELEEENKKLTNIISTALETAEQNQKLREALINARRVIKIIDEDSPILLGIEQALNPNQKER